ncbi:unnamed protein product [Ectocarpus sp. 4 AP-2014]
MLATLMPGPSHHDLRVLMAWKKSVIAFVCVSETEEEKTDIGRTREYMNPCQGERGSACVRRRFYGLRHGRRFAARFPLGLFVEKPFATVSESRGKHKYSSI